MRNPPRTGREAAGPALGLRTGGPSAEMDGAGYPVPPPAGTPAIPLLGAGSCHGGPAGGGTLPATGADEPLPPGKEDRARLFAERLGARLRAARRRQRLSLLDVERTSDGEFRASVLGAYERGERTISVVRLQRLAQLYNLPVGRLLVDDVGDQGSGPPCPDGPGPRRKLTIDLARLALADFPGKALLAAYVHSVQVQRQDFDSPVITLRDDDTRLLAEILSLSVDRLRHQLQERGVVPR